jgi:hypothetical protein
MLSGMEIVHVSRLLAQRETLKTEGKMELVSGLTYMYRVLEQSLSETESPIGNVIGPTTHPPLVYLSKHRPPSRTNRYQTLRLAGGSDR